MTAAPSDPSHAEIADDGLAGLMIAAQAGDQRAYSTLLRNCIPIIKAVARKTGAPADCLDDVIQETLMTVHRARHTFEPGRPFVPWLSVLAQRRTIDVLRSLVRNRGREVHAPFAYDNFPDGQRTPEQHMDATSRSAALKSALDGLPPAQRDVLQRLAIDGQSLAEAAVATNRNKVALKVNFHRALATLRTRFSSEDS